jgi:DNA-binding CsgD family transcriptional regulator
VLDRIRRGPDQPEELTALTDQERKILDLIVEGLTNRQIAERMFLAEKTVKNYVSSLAGAENLVRAGRGGGGGLDSQDEQFAVDAAVTPAGVLPARRSTRARMERTAGPYRRRVNPSQRSNWLSG